jgi:hypothetical protein
MVIGHDLNILEVDGMMSLVLVGRFMGKFVKCESLKCWLVENRLPFNGYIPKFHILL